MEITFLGTSSMVPTKERNVSAIFLAFRDEGILFDCGEGTQRQMNLCGINRNKVTRIFLSHWHADHVAGIPGLLQTISNREQTKHIFIYGPKGTKQRMQHLIDAFVHDSYLKLTVEEFDPDGMELCCDTERFQIFCSLLQHTAASIGFAFVEKDVRNIDMGVLAKLGVKAGRHLRDLQAGKDITYKGKKIKVDEVTKLKKGRKLAYIPDTKYCHNAIDLAENADLVICEATYSNSLEDKAMKHKHLTAGQAAQIASQAGAKKLILTHFSQRYKDTQEIEDDARTIFDDTVCANDFMRIKI